MNSNDFDPPFPVLWDWQQALTLSLRLQPAASLLLLIFFSALLVSLLPLRMFDPSWYLTIADRLTANAPIAITAGCFSVFSLVLSPLRDEQHYVRTLRFQRFFYFLAAIYLALLPLELLATSLFIIHVNSEKKEQQLSLQRQHQQISNQIKSAVSIDVLNALVPPRFAPPIGSTFSQQRASMLQSLNGNLLQARRQLNVQHDQRVLSLSLNGLRIALIGLATGIFFRWLAKPSEQLLAGIIPSFLDD